MASVAEQLASNISFSAFRNATELKKRIWFTLLALLVYRLGTYLPLPGINIDTLRQIFEQNQSGIIGIFNMFFPSGSVVFEVAGIFPYGGESDTIAGNEVAAGVRYQKNLNHQWIFRSDAMMSHRENNENQQGIRFELRYKF